jgi:hypothetical protein
MSRSSVKVLTVSAFAGAVDLGLCEASNWLLEFEIKEIKGVTRVERCYDKGVIRYTHDGSVSASVVSQALRSGSFAVAA